MNTPNKLTILRIFLAPVFLLLLLIPFPHHLLAAFLAFSLASLTDLADGKLARKYGLVTDFGKFLDPLADKMLTTAAFLGFLALGYGVGMVWVTFIILTREFLVTSLRLIAAGNGKVVAANLWGKAKTVFQMSSILITMAAEYVVELGVLPEAAVSPLRWGYTALLWISAALTILSGITYLVDNRKFIDPRK